MEYQFVNDARPGDFWLLAMSRTYRSLAGVCNIVFTVAIIAETIHFWESVNDILQVLLLLACMIFTVFQPFFVYMNSKTQAALIPRGMKLLFNDRGLTVTVGDRSEDIPWKKITGLIIERRLVFIKSDNKHGYVLTNRMLGKDKASFIEFASNKINK